MFTVSVQPATVSACDFIGRNVRGVVAVVLRDGVEVFRSKPSVKRFGPKVEAAEFIAAQAEVGA